MVDLSIQLHFDFNPRVSSLSKFILYFLLNFKQYLGRNDHSQKYVTIHSIFISRRSRTKFRYENSQQSDHDSTKRSRRRTSFRRRLYRSIDGYTSSFSWSSVFFIFWSCIVVIRLILFIIIIIIGIFSERISIPSSIASSVPKSKSSRFQDRETYVRDKETEEK